MEQVVLKNVYKKYGEVDAVNNLSFSCKEGEFLAMLGPSGCGKSSTLRMIAGLEEITQGEIYIVNRLVNSLPPGSRNIALAFENYALYPPLTVFENIAFPLQASGMDYTKFRRRVNEVAEILNLTKILKRRPSKLSGGQQQLTSLARALVKPADVYLLDEPISHMDADLRNKMRGELRRIHKEMGATFIYVTHDQLEALSMADRIAIMNFGNLQQIGTVFEIYNHPANLFVAGFIGEPPMNLLEMVLVTKNGMVTCNVDGNLIPITKELKNRVKSNHEKEYIIGIRPNNIFVSNMKTENCNIPSEIDIYEDLGTRVILTVRIGDHNLMIETLQGFKAEMGQKVWLGFDASRIVLFDKKSGESIL